MADEQKLSKAEIKSKKQTEFVHILIEELDLVRVNSHYYIYNGSIWEVEDDENIIF